MLLVKHPKSKDPSVTLTAFIAGFFVATIKLALSGLVIGSIQFGLFSGSDYGLAVGALGTIYTLNKHSQRMTMPSGKENSNEN